MTLTRRFLIGVGVCTACVVGVVILLYVADAPTATDSEELERQALVAEGKFISAEMERANCDHDLTRVNEIRRRDADFKRRSADYLIRHGHTRPPER